MISSTAPIFVTFLGFILLKESCGTFELFNIMFTLIGIVIVMQPPFIFDRILGENFAQALTINGDGESSFEYKKKHFYVAIFALVGTLFSSMSIIATRSLKVSLNINVNTT